MNRRFNPKEALEVVANICCSVAVSVERDDALLVSATAQSSESNYDALELFLKRIVKKSQKKE